MKKGFTLIELLIVVIIIGILATMAIPQYSRLIDKTKRVEAVTMLSSLGTASVMYYMQVGSLPNTTIDTTDRNLYVSVPAQGNWEYKNILDTANPKEAAVWQARYKPQHGWKVAIKTEVPEGAKTFYEKREPNEGSDFTYPSQFTTDYKIIP